MSKELYFLELPIRGQVFGENRRREVRYSCCSNCTRSSCRSGKTNKNLGGKDFAQARNLPVLQPSNLKNPEFTEQLSELKPDLMVVVAFRCYPSAFGQFLPENF